MELLSIFFWYTLPLAVYLSAYITMRKGLKSYTPKPAYAPPGWFIAVMWLVLYMLQGTAAWLLMNHNGGSWTYELTMYSVLLGLSFLYGPVFSRQIHKLTFFYTFLLFAYSAVVDGFFFKKYAWSGWILLPTVIWLVFATWLSFTTYQNNLYRRSRYVSDSSDDETSEDDEYIYVDTSRERQPVVKRVPFATPL